MVPVSSKHSFTYTGTDNFNPLFNVSIELLLSVVMAVTKVCIAFKTIIRSNSQEYLPSNK